MCIKIIGESEFNQVVFLSVDTNNSWKSLDINKTEDIQMQDNEKLAARVRSYLIVMLCAFYFNERYL